MEEVRMMLLGPDVLIGVLEIAFVGYLLRFPFMCIDACSLPIFDICELQTGDVAGVGLCAVFLRTAKEGYRLAIYLWLGAK